MAFFDADTLCDAVTLLQGSDKSDATEEVPDQLLKGAAIVL